MSGNKVETIEKKLQFDPDWSADNPHNEEVAKQLGLTYDSKSKIYRDNEGFPVRDEYGQKLG